MSSNNEIIVEFKKIGAYVKVSAVDPVSREEVSIMGSPSESRETLSNTAIQKLKYVLEKKNLSS